MSEKNHFAAVASEYARFRPGYPAELYDWLAQRVDRHDRAWDCGCGTGQASAALAKRFAQVIATDASTEQIAAATPHDRVRYRVASAESSGLDENSVDLIAVAQALHWFDVGAFYVEARRVARPHALLAAWTYVTPEPGELPIRHALADFYQNTVGPYWPPERRHVETRYADLNFPLPRVAAPEFSLRLNWSQSELLGYVSSWTACARYRSATGRDPIDVLAEALRPLWRPQSAKVDIVFPITLLAARL